LLFGGPLLTEGGRAASSSGKNRGEKKREKTEFFHHLNKITLSPKEMQAAIASAEKRSYWGGGKGEEGDRAGRRSLSRPKESTCSSKKEGLGKRTRVPISSKKS